ncbi:MAG: group 1 glycosyl transferase [Alphaproteobacteria bacterium]|nr:MAG: group 1 glycosyl transferase [Caulobacteraceae bacterium]TPW08116.1 MAG: group 1 glycosyl transferase [Alphaproteobacteria bacterium]
MTRRLVIIEPNLRTVGGHCFDYVRVIAREAAAAGFAVRGVFHAEAAPEIAALGIPFTRVFRRASPVPQSRTGLGGLAVAVLGEKTTQRLRRAVLGAPAGEDDATAARAAPFVDELAQAIASLDWKTGDRAYLPTLFWAEAVLAARQSHEITSRGARVSMCLRFDPPESAEGRDALRRAAMEAVAIDWCADTGELAAAYAAILGRTVRTIRIPVDLARLSEDAVQRPLPPPVRVAFIGESRREKGFHLLPDIVATVRRDADAEVRFTIQLMPGEAGADPSVTKAMARLRAGADGVDLVHGALDQDAFHGVLAASHVLLLPYAANAYARRSSGLLVEGLAAGLAIVTPAAESWITRTIACNGAETGAFTYEDGEAGLPGAVLRAVRAVAGGLVVTPRAPDCATMDAAPWTDRV